MRFWNAFVPIALVPIVAADFHHGTVSCKFPQILKPLEYGVILPSYNDTCEAATSPNLDVQQLYNFHESEHHPVLVSICNVSVMWSRSTHNWTSRDGTSGGVCYDLSGGSQTQNCNGGVAACQYIDEGYCTSHTCATPGSSEAQ
ncbi:uncharacterized protein EI90DRAFT_3046728 [Cantharellus anzutake]|uniref:uncharacterized protein n=1 Tax=Cantharellus anzutake TaxID=1750568 RepID=UPI0019063A97|nr:uncharacterized protein EI90DRAFT_3046728 [Cantharellus anzutake]KAF8335675.1 hypothetical protein EI90DRAFT_3046728 [Cantharellus anzutake]